jgi:hypothetical protein
VNLSGSFSVGCLCLSAWVDVAIRSCRFTLLRLRAREVEAIIGSLAGILVSREVPTLLMQPRLPMHLSISPVDNEVSILLSIVKRYHV